MQGSSASYDFRQMYDHIDLKIPNQPIYYPHYQGSLRQYCVDNKYFNYIRMIEKVGYDALLDTKDLNLTLLIPKQIDDCIVEMPVSNLRYIVDFHIMPVKYRKNFILSQLDSNLPTNTEFPINFKQYGHTVVVNDYMIADDICETTTNNATYITIPRLLPSYNVFKKL